MKDSLNISSTMKSEYEVVGAQDLIEIKKIINDFKTPDERWKKFINDKMEEGGFSFEGLSKMSDISRNTLKRWCRDGKIPRTRLQFVKLGIGMKMSLEDINKMLTRYGRMPKLYSKSLEDAIYIFVIEHYSETERPIDMYRRIEEEYLDIMKIKNPRVFDSNITTNTLEAEKEISKMESEDDFSEFVEKHKDAFINSYYKLVDYIDTYIKVESKSDSYHNFINSLELDSGFEVALSKLKNWGEIPSRNRLLALGIHLNMSLDEINKMLTLARMEPMYAADKVESVIMFALVNISLNFPEFELMHARWASKYTENEQLRNELQEFLERQTSLRTSFDLGIEIDEYVQSVLSEIDMEETKEILQYL